MANVLVNDLYLSDIADAIREKLDTEDTYKPSEMANAIESIGGGGSSLGTKSITANGTYNASSDSLDGYSQVTVNVPQGSTPTGTKQITITQNGTTSEDVTNYATASITANVPNTYAAGDEGKVVSNGSLVAQTSDTVTTNDTYDTTLINSLTVNVSGGGASFATGSFTPSSNELSHTIDVGGSYDHFILYADTNSEGNGVKASRVLVADFSKTNYLLLNVGTNNSGTGVASQYYTTGTISKSGNNVIYSSGNQYLVPVLYKWIAW